MRRWWIPSVAVGIAVAGCTWAWRTWREKPRRTVADRYRARQMRVSARWVRVRQHDAVVRDTQRRPEGPLAAPSDRQDHERRQPPPATDLPASP